MSIYDFTVKNIKQEDVALKKYEGHVLLIVNTATACGYTPQYKDLQVLFQTFHKSGFEILDFPCNQFFNQAKGSDEELAQFCQLNYQTTFETFAKIKVNGKEAHPLFKYLKQQVPKDMPTNSNAPLSGLKKVLNAVKTNDQKRAIKWNFTKFLVDRKGQVIHRFGPTFQPEDIKPYIEKLI
ncbi:MAG: glutathione peroxidase [Acholeplasmataceae bacterium]